MMSKYRKETHVHMFTDTKPNQMEREFLTISIRHTHTGEHVSRGRTTDITQAHTGMIQDREIRAEIDHITKMIPVTVVVTRIVVADDKDLNNQTHT